MFKRLFMDVEELENRAEFWKNDALRTLKELIAVRDRNELMSKTLREKNKKIEELEAQIKMLQ